MCSKHVCFYSVIRNVLYCVNLSTVLNGSSGTRKVADKIGRDVTGYDYYPVFFLVKTTSVTTKDPKLRCIYIQ